MALLTVGAPAPSFRLPNQDGIRTGLDQFRGHYLVLWWYPKADTPVCTVEGKGFRDMYHEFSAKNAQILGVSLDPPVENRRFREQFGFPYDLLSDVTRDMSMAYGAVETKEAPMSARISYLIDPDGRVARVYGNVIATQHADELLRDVGGAASMFQSSRHGTGRELAMASTKRKVR